MKKNQFLLGAIGVSIAFFLSLSFSQSKQDNRWVAPKSADKIINPLKNNIDAIKSGKKLYRAMCAVCHGQKGKGDGMAGTGLNPRPANFTKNIFQSQSDGAIFWKLTEGRSPMASYKESLSEEKRWQIVNYLRTFK